MKVTFVILAAVVCFAVINAAPSEQLQSVEYYADDAFGDDDFSDEVYELQLYNIFSPFYWHLKSAMRLLKGVNCSIKQAIGIKEIAQGFVNKLQLCGADAVRDFKNVIASSTKVIAICNNILNLNEKVCNNGESTNGKKTSPWSCTCKLFKQFYLLKKNIENTLKAIKKVPTVPGDAAYCTNSAVNSLIDEFSLFPSNVFNCSKLTHN